MQQSNAELLFPAVGGKAVVGRFDGGDITSDAGFLLLAQADQKIGLTHALAGAMVDKRQASKVVHPLQVLLQERIYAIAAGYPDANDGDSLRFDPALKLACQRRPESDAPLASQPTLSRLENGVSAQELVHMSLALAQRVIAQLPADTRHVVLDVDASDDPCHGQQQFEEFNAYYDTHCYLPLFVHVTAEDGRQRLLGVLLRPGKAAATTGLRGLLGPAIRLLRARFPQLHIILRLRSGCVPTAALAVIRCCAYATAGVSITCWGWGRMRVCRRSRRRCKWMPVSNTSGRARAVASSANSTTARIPGISHVA
jgi:Transposase DDE domain group 1